MAYYGGHQGHYAGLLPNVGFSAIKKSSCWHDPMPSQLRRIFGASVIQAVDREELADAAARR
jgi:hypothetical protein